MRATVQLSKLMVSPCLTFPLRISRLHSTHPLNKWTFTQSMAMTLSETPFFTTVTIKIPIPFTNQYISQTVDCDGTMNADLQNWNLSLTVAPDASNCSLSLDLIDSVISEGDFNLQTAFEQSECQNIFAFADFAVDVEELIKTEFVAQIPDILQDEVEKALDGGLQAGDFEICIANVSIFEDETLFVSGDLIFPLMHDSELVFAANTTSELVFEDDSSLIVFFVIMCVLGCTVGCCLGAFAFWGCYKESFRIYYRHRNNGKGQLMEHINDTTAVQMEKITTR